MPPEKEFALFGLIPISRTNMRRALRLLFFRSRTLRRILTPIGAWRMGRDGIRLAHLGFYREESAFGPIQREEALLLAAVVRVLRPRTIVEFGFGLGFSALNFLEAMTPDARLYSYDLNPPSRDIAKWAFAGEPRFTYLHKSQTDFDPVDIEGGPIDLCFIDASHVLELNQKTWRRIAPCLAPSALVAVHDTGTWHRKHFNPATAVHAAQKPDGWLDADVFQPHREEREFVNWVCVQHDGWTAVHLHTTATLRHGLSLLQRVGALPTTKA
jgi:predicted O-methyltransferase YrrM